MNVDFELLDSLTAKERKTLSTLLGGMLGTGYYDTYLDVKHIEKRWSVIRAVQSLCRKGVLEHKPPVTVQVKRKDVTVTIDYPERYEISNKIIS